MAKGYKKEYIVLIVSLFILLFIPIAYYFCYALPQHNKVLQQIELEKLEHEKEVARQEQERIEQEKWEKEQEKLEKQREKEEKERKYSECINIANEWRRENFDRYCDLSYKTCKQSVDDWNNTHSYNQVNYSECNSFKKDKDGNCSLYNYYAEERKEGYDRQLKMCDQFL